MTNGRVYDLKVSVVSEGGVAIERCSMWWVGGLETRSPVQLRNYCAFVVRVRCGGGK